MSDKPSETRAPQQMSEPLEKTLWEVVGIYAAIILTDGRGFSHTVERLIEARTELEAVLIYRKQRLLELKVPGHYVDGNNAVMYTVKEVQPDARKESEGAEVDGPGQNGGIAGEAVSIGQSLKEVQEPDTWQESNRYH